MGSHGLWSVLDIFEKCLISEILWGIFPHLILLSFTFLGLPQSPAAVNFWFDFRISRSLKIWLGRVNYVCHVYRIEYAMCTWDVYMGHFSLNY